MSSHYDSQADKISREVAKQLDMLRPHLPTIGAAHEEFDRVRALLGPAEFSATVDALRPMQEARERIAQSASIRSFTTPSRSGAENRQSEVLKSIATLGPIIRTARKAMRMTQAQFAAHAGVGRRFVSELEGGKPSLEFDKVLACCAAAGIDIIARPRSLACG